MSYIVSQGTNSYKEAIKATESLESPAIGFARPSDYKGGSSAPAAIIKQCNTQLQLLIKISEELKDLREELKVIKEEIRAVKNAASTSGTKGIPDDLIDKLEGLTLGKTTEKVPEKKGLLKGFKDPKRILEEVKRSL